MELKEFIKATITAIAESVEELNNELKEKAIVNPKEVRMLNDSSQTDRLLHVLEYGHAVGSINDGRLVQDIEFNLAITEAQRNEKGAGIRIEVISAGVNNKKEIENINTVKFSIPVAFLK